MKANEVKLESDKRRLKEVLDASESRTIKLELQRRSLEGELQRSRLGLSDREAQAQALQDRVDSLQRQVGPRDPWRVSHLHTQCRVLYGDYIILPTTLRQASSPFRGQTAAQRGDTISQDSIAKRHSEN